MFTELFGDYILIKEDRRETKSGLALAPRGYDEMGYGTVLLTGPGAEGRDMEVEEDDRVAFIGMGIPTSEGLLITMKDLIGKVENE